MRFKISNIMWGLIFIVVGMGFAGNAFNLWDFELFFDGWWTLFIIIPCAASLIKNGFNSSSLIGLLIGIMLLLSARDIIDGSILGKLWLPIIFVLIGINMILKNIYRNGEYGRARIEYQGGSSEYSAVFGGGNYQVVGEKFMGTSMNAVFGGVELDLRNAIIDEDVVINATAVFGGIEIWVPSHVRVKVSNVPIFGGVDNRANRAIEPDAPTIFVNSTCMFGGIEIK